MRKQRIFNKTMLVCVTSFPSRPWQDPYVLVTFSTKVFYLSRVLIFLAYKIEINCSGICVASLIARFKFRIHILFWDISKDTWPTWVFQAIYWPFLPLKVDAKSSCRRADLCNLSLDLCNLIVRSLELLFLSPSGTMEVKSIKSILLCTAMSVLEVSWVL